MKTTFKLVLTTLAILVSINCVSQNWSIQNVEYLDAQSSQIYTSIYGCPTILDYSCYTDGGCYSTEGAPLPWGEFNGNIDKTYFVGGDCYTLSLDIDINMVNTDDQVLIYEPDNNNNMVVTAVINGNCGFENYSYIYKNVSSYRAAYVYIRVIKTSPDDPSLYNNSYYTFRGICWWCSRN